MKSLNQFLKDKIHLKDDDYMREVLDFALQAKSNGDLPVAASLVWAGGRRLIEHDTRSSDKNPLNYAVINVINKAADTLKRGKVKEAVLYSNVEPNLLCGLAIKAAGIKEVIFGVFDDKEGFLSANLLSEGTNLDISSIGGVLGEESFNILPQSMQECTRYE
jgi:tRNA(Arg) A34 adenosine deaminase TadA